MQPALSAGQLQYAATDAWVGLVLYYWMCAQPDNQRTLNHALREQRLKTAAAAASAPTAAAVAGASNSAPTSSSAAAPASSSAASAASNHSTLPITPYAMPSDTALLDRSAHELRSGSKQNVWKLWTEQLLDIDEIAAAYVCCLGVPLCCHTKGSFFFLTFLVSWCRRSVQQATVMGYLADFIACGHAYQWERCGVSDALYERIDRACEQRFHTGEQPSPNPNARDDPTSAPGIAFADLSDLKRELPDLAYGPLKMVLAHRFRLRWRFESARSAITSTCTTAIDRDGHGGKRTSY